jgi:hypothetical protein
VATLSQDALEPFLTRMGAVLANAQAEISLTMGGYTDVTVARLWQGDVLVEWERDDFAGGCLLRPALVRRLVILGATVERDQPRGASAETWLVVRARPRVVQSLSDRHAHLAAQLGGQASLRLTLRFAGAEGSSYLGGEETYAIEPSTRQRLRRGSPLRAEEAVLLRLTTTVQPRSTPRVS